jgi:hypothetical protein
MWRRAFGWLALWLTATMLAAVAVSLAQTQLNLAALARLGAEIPLSVRLKASAHDLLSFAPLFALLLGLAYLIAFAVAEALARRFPGLREVLFPLAGLSAMAVLLGLLELALPVSLIAAARSAFGIALLLLAGAFGGWIFERLRTGQALASGLAKRSARAR